MGPKGVKAVYENENLKVKSIADLKTAIENDKLIERLAFADYIESG